MGWLGRQAGSGKQAAAHVRTPPAPHTFLPSLPPTHTRTPHTHARLWLGVTVISFSVGVMMSATFVLLLFLPLTTTLFR